MKNLARYRVRKAPGLRLSRFSYRRWRLGLRLSKAPRWIRIATEGPHED